MEIGPLVEMKREEAEKRIDFLINEITRLNDAYYGRSESLVSDREYDLLLEELNSLENIYPELKREDSPTQKVGSSLIGSTFEKIKHKKPMLSLKNSYSKEDIELFIEDLKANVDNYDITIEAKMDGLAISIMYENGKFIQAVTRGDGIIGEDVTESVRQIQNVPMNIKYYKPLEVRGEILLSYEEFERINKIQKEKLLPLFKNPRNLASGTLRQKDASIIKDRNLSFVAYDVVSDDFIKENEYDRTNVYNSLGDLGFETVDWITSFDAENAEVYSDIEYFGQKARLKTSKYPLDGCVIKLQNYIYYEQMGFTSKFPKGAIAFKFETDKAETTLKEVIIQVGRTGKLTPVAIFEPVELAGTTVSAASLHNYSEINKMELMIGDRILVEKAAEIIPQVVSVIKSKRNGTEKYISRPDKCPRCGSELWISPTGIDIFCGNPNCPDKVIAKIEHYCSRDCANIIGLSTNWIKRLVNLDLLKDIPDIYELHINKIVITCLDGSGPKFVSNLLQAIEDSKKISFNKILNGLGITGIGTVNANLLANVFGNIQAIKELSIDKLKSLDGFSEIKAKQVYDWFRDENNWKMICKLIDAGVQMEMKPDDNIIKDSFLNKKAVCVTGKLNLFKNRKEVEDIVTLHGGINVGSITKYTDYLIVGEDAGSKLAKAKNISTITILSEEDFHNMIKEYNDK